SPARSTCSSCVRPALPGGADALHEAADGGDERLLLGRSELGRRPFELRLLPHPAALQQAPARRRDAHADAAAVLRIDLPPHNLTLFELGQKTAQRGLRDAGEGGEAP